MDRETVEAWVEGYLQAWNSNNPEDIGHLFSEDAVYATGPFDEPWQGREAIVAGWLDRKDQPGNFDFRYQVLAVTGDLGVIRGWTIYQDPPWEYSNIWVIRINAEGRCFEFTEWWMQRST